MTCRLDFDSAALRRPAASIREDKWTTTLLVQSIVTGTYLVDRLVPQRTAFLRYHVVCKAERARELSIMSNRDLALQVAAALRSFSDHHLSRRITDYLQNPRMRLRGRFDGNMFGGEANARSLLALQHHSSKLLYMSADVIVLALVHIQANATTATISRQSGVTLASWRFGEPPRLRVGTKRTLWGISWSASSGIPSETSAVDGGTQDGCDWLQNVFESVDFLNSALRLNHRSSPFYNISRILYTSLTTYDLQHQARAWS